MVEKDKDAWCPTRSPRAATATPPGCAPTARFIRPTQQISAFILQKLKQDAEAHGAEKVEKAVITVPAYFNDAQRQGDQGRRQDRRPGDRPAHHQRAYLPPALAYGLEKNDGKKIAVYDLGGGTFDVSILEIGDGVFEVKATNGDTFLGGEDFDLRVVDYLADEFKKEQGVDLRKDKLALQRLKEEAEKGQEGAVHHRPVLEVNLPFISMKRLRQGPCTSTSSSPAPSWKPWWKT